MVPGRDYNLLIWVGLSPAPSLGSFNKAFWARGGSTKVVAFMSLRELVSGETTMRTTVVLLLSLAFGVCGMGCGTLGDFEDLADELDLDDRLEDVTDHDHYGGGFTIIDDFGGFIGGSDQYEVGFARGDFEGYNWGLGDGAAAAPYLNFEIFAPPGNPAYQQGWIDGFLESYDDGYKEGLDQFYYNLPW